MESRLESREAIDRPASRLKREEPVAPGTELASAVRLLAEDLPHLVREELALAKLQARTVAIRGAIAGALGGAGLLGTIFILIAAAIVVSQLTERLWAGPLAVGLALAVGAGIALPIVLRRLSPGPSPGAA